MLCRGCCTSMRRAVCSRSCSGTDAQPQPVSWCSLRPMALQRTAAIPMLTHSEYPCIVYYVLCRDGPGQGQHSPGTGKAVQPGPGPPGSYGEGQLPWVMISWIKLRPRKIVLLHASPSHLQVALLTRRDKCCSLDPRTCTGLLWP